MMKWTYTFLLLSAFILSGCTPFGEQIVKKGDNAPADGMMQFPSNGESIAAVGANFDPSSRTIIQNYGPVIRRFADYYGFDWRLILAVIKQESRFSTVARSKRGAEGLMQIMPSTGEEVARMLEIKDMNHPRENIRGGIYYLRTLYDHFETADEGDRIKLTLAAYNAGIGRIYDAQELAAYMHDNPLRWQSIKDALPLLSKRYYTLHKSVWQQDKPKAGWFGKSNQTVAYVENIMEFYDGYRLQLN